MNKRSINLMAPVGSYESLHAAIQGGANSIYFGVENLNMRSRSSNNFTIDDLNEIAKIAHSSGLQTYLTINTVLYDSEIEKMKEIVDAAVAAKISALIVTDQAVLEYAKNAGIEIHLSTQLNISNFESLRFYSNYADVAVLARELNLEQVKQITDKVKKEKLCGPSGKLMQVEIFAHGALCMSISGKCYLSLHEKNYSANRGACLQTCRKAYTVTEKESGNQLEIDHEYIMSPKDLWTIHFLNKILDAGVSVLKIEGRARSPEYVKTVCECYNEAIDSYLNATYTEEKIKQWQHKLRTVFNRDFWDGYYLGQKLGEWSHKYGSRATKRKIFIGKVSNFFKKIEVAEISIETGIIELNNNYIITGPTTGVIEGSINELRVDLHMVEKAKKGEKFSMKVPGLVRRGDKLYKIVDADQIKQQ